MILLKRSYVYALGIALLALIFVNGCSTMKVVDFKGKEPYLTLEEFFQGRTVATGLFQDRFGNVRRQFTVQIDGTWDGETLTLDEHFLYDDGETEQRLWTLRKLDEHRYEGSAPGVIGMATGAAYGNAFNWRYEFDLKVGDGSWRVQFDDWMFLQETGVLLNIAHVKKFGVELGTVTLSFAREDDAASHENTAALSSSPLQAAE